ncbi:MAG: glycoside hydrolase family 3 C-terminal domain-containing protein [Bacilli bacterium]|jgi:beta-glucosidase
MTSYKNIPLEIKNLPLRTKLELLYGDGFWRVRGIKELDLKPFDVSDGPHGLRKQVTKSDQLGIAASLPATCFPTASLVACSFDENLIFEMGQAIAKEALHQKVAVVLGPGVNIKRNPLCGRNFEYFSEDPLLSGKMGASFIKGVQSLGVGTSLKHYAANNQETDRLVINAVIDPRALFELYLKPFKIAVQEGEPYTVMCSYNRINGIYSSDNNWLLNTLLRHEWKYEGLVVTDWGAINDDYLSRKSGTDLEMPGIGKRYRNLMRGIKKKMLTEADVDICVSNVYNLHQKVKDLEYTSSCDYEEHFSLARIIAAQSSVLLKNDGILPLKSFKKVAIIGSFAEYPRYQGTGSSKVTPHKLVSFLQWLENEKIEYNYAPGYKHNSDAVDEELESHALDLAKASDTIVVLIGLPDAYESEGFDRDNMSLPECHLSLVDKLTKLGKKVIVVLQCGSPIELPFVDQINGLILTYLAGEACGPALADVLLGRVNPSGKLPETWPLKYSDTPSAKYFPGDGTNVLYKESIFVGYRYFDTANVPVLYPFGYGLSYTTFIYDNLDIKYDFINQQIQYNVSFDVTNKGDVEGKEVVQLYVSSNARGTYKPRHELKGFNKVTLQPNESKRVTIIISIDDLKLFDLSTHEFILEKGVYLFEVGSSSRDIRLKKEIIVEGEDTAYLHDEELVNYNKPSAEFVISDQEFEKILQAKLPIAINRRKRPFSKNSTLRDIEDTLVGKIIRKLLKRIAAKMKGEDIEATRKMFIESAMTMPLRGYTMSGMMSNGAIDGLVHMANRKFLKGIWCMMFKGK